MNPQQPTTQMDPQAIALAKAIRKTESNDNFNAKGKSGEFGAYQFMPTTWKQFAKETFGNENTEMSPSNQNAVAYTMIKKWKDIGLNPAQIAAKWNSGSHEGWENKVGVNKMGVSYDVPAYVKKVTDAYQTFKVPLIETAQASNGETPTQPTTGLFGQNTQDTLYGQLLDNSITRGIKAIFPGEKIGQSIGTLGGYVASGFNPDYDISAPTPLQVAGDIAQAALMVGTGQPTGTAGVQVLGKTVPVMQTATTALGRIGQASAVGAGLTGTGAIAEGETNVGQILKESAVGGIAGGTFGVAGEVINKTLTSLPNRFAKFAFPGLKTPEALDYAVKNTKVGTLPSMIEHNQKSMNSFNSQIKTILAHPDNVDIKIKPETIIDGVLETFPRSEYTPSSIFNTIKKQVPSEAATISKLQKGIALNLEDSNKLRQVLDSRTYKPSALDTPEIKAGKELIEAFGNSIRKQVQTLAPETQPIFANYSKEITLSKVLNKLKDKSDSKSILSLMDLASMGFGTISGIGPAVGLVGQKVLQAPETKIMTAKALSSVSPVANKAQQAFTRNVVPVAIGGVSSQQRQPTK